MQYTNNFYEAVKFCADDARLPTTTLAMPILKITTIKMNDDTTATVYLPAVQCSGIRKIALGGGELITVPNFVKVLARSSVMNNTWSPMGKLPTTQNETKGIMFGSGSTPESINDVDLESPTSLPLTTAGCYTYLQVQNGKLKRTLVIPVTNNGSDPAVFQEIGFVGSVNVKAVASSYNGSGSSTTINNYIPFMLARHVFQNPITIQPTDVKTIVFTYETVLGSSTDYPDTAQTPGY